MIQQKDKFLNFFFSLMPGAGQMHLGFLKQGCSIMTIFFGVCAIGASLNVPVILFAIPVIWFYSFFDSLNKNSLNSNDFYKLEDHFLCNLDLSDFHMLLNGKARLIIGAVFILIGLSSLSSYFTTFLREFLPDEVYWFIMNIFHQAPRFILAVFIILVGIRLIRGKKIELNEKEETEEKSMD